ncbi:MAG TPA: hypothetical protein VLQ52_03490, partial [Coriobacteriia bacterium]|nr:hypothetical protein [Coriobacteriia bacterium]
EQLLAGEWLPGEVVLVDLEDGAVVFRKTEGQVEEAEPPVASSPKATMPTRSGRSRRGGVADGAAGA